MWRSSSPGPTACPHRPPPATRSSALELKRPPGGADLGAMRWFGGIAWLAAGAALLGAGPASASAPLRAEWYSDTGLQKLARVGGDDQINFQWGEAQDLPGVGHRFSVRWTGRISPRYSEQYRFMITRDDVARLWVGGQLLFDEKWDTTNYPGTVTTDPIVLQANRKYDLKLEFAHSYGAAQIRLAWKSPSQWKQIVPASRLFGPAPAQTPDGNALDVHAPGPKLPAAPQADAGRTFSGRAQTGKVRIKKPGSKRSRPLG